MSVGDKRATWPAPSDRTGAAESEATDHDWFDHVDVIAHGRSGVIKSFESGAPLPPGEPSQTGKATSVVDNRYRGIPGWALLPQLFLAAGWGRAGLAHMLSSRWRSGEEVLDFLANDTLHHLGFYRYVLTDVVEPFSMQVAYAVGIGEILIALLLAFNFRANWALAVAAFLNVQFILAGAVNPSIFYLVATIGIAIWRLESAADPRTTRRLAHAAMGIGIVFAVFLIPWVRTIEPEGAIEDPALVLIFLITLLVGTLWWVDHRLTLVEAPSAVGHNGQSGQSGPAPRSSSRLFPAALLVVSLLATVTILFGGFVLLTSSEDAGNETASALDEDRATAQSDQSDQTAAQGSAETPSLGSLGLPYPFGQPVSLSYIDPASGERSAWQVDVLDSALTSGDGVDLRPALSDTRLVSVRVLLTYQSAETAGQREDLRFQAVDSNGSPFSVSNGGCGENEVLPASGDELVITDRMEGWMCWWVSEQSLDDLLLSVEATPADGVLYMSLNPN